MAVTAAQVGATLLAGFRTHTNNWNDNPDAAGVALTTGDALEIQPAGIPIMVPEYGPNAGVVGGVGLPRMGLSVIKYKMQGPIKANGRFNCAALSRLIACFFGSETVASLGSGAYTHLFQIAANSAYVGNFAYYDNQLYHDIPMTRVESLMFEWEAGAIPTVTIGIVGKREYVDSSLLNTSSNINTTTLTFPTPSPAPTVLFPLLAASVCTVRFNNASTIALAAGDVPTQGITKFSIEFKRKFEMVYSNLNTPYPDEPIYGPDFEVTATLGFSRQAAVAEWTRLITQAETKLDVAFTGSTIGGGYTWKWLFEIPCAVPAGDGAPSVSKTGVLSYDMGISCYEAIANPSGMAFSRPRLTITDTTSAAHATNGV